MIGGASIIAKVRPVPRELRDTFWRSLQTLNITRVAIAVVLLLYLSLNNKTFSVAGPPLFLWLCILYLILAVFFTLLKSHYQRHFYYQLVSQITIDIAVISSLYTLAGGVKSGLAILFLFPLAGASILAPMFLSLFFAATVTLLLLSEDWYRVLVLDSEPSTMQVGLYCAALFSVTVVVNRLAASLIGQEELATQRGNALEIQQAINRLVIADMGDGVMVVGQDSVIFTCNPAAQSMLGLSFPEGDGQRVKLTDISSLQPIADAFFNWKSTGVGHAGEGAAPAYVSVKPGEVVLFPGISPIFGNRRDLVLHLKLRFATVETPHLPEERSVIFLQDYTEIENQAQQLKLASMGRLTASIAHEVRNPLSAISHAAALLAEDLSDASHARLLNIVSDNVARVNRMVEDILQLSRKVQSHGEPLSIFPFLMEIRGELQETHALPEGVLMLVDTGQFHVRFDPLHLREVVTNLLSNAIRYASGTEGSIRMQLVSGASNRLELHVQDDGPGITPEVRSHLFEPFYTTSSKGTGLGLYLARELCLNNGAMLDYEYRMNIFGDKLDEAKGRFVVTFAASDPNLI